MSTNCVRCPYDRPHRATQTRFFTVGESPDVINKVRLCDRCTLLFDREFNSWVRFAEFVELKEPAPRVSRAAGGSGIFRDGDAAKIRELKEKAAQRAGTTVVADEDETVALIGPRGDEWRFSVHAQKRAKQRGFSPTQVLKAAAYPENVFPCANPKYPDSVYHIADDCSVVVNPKMKIIITVYEKFNALFRISEENHSQQKGIA